MAQEAIKASSPPRKVGARPQSSDPNQGHSRWPLAFPRSISNNSIASSSSNSGIGAGPSGGSSASRANGRTIRSHRGKHSLSRALKGVAEVRPGSASTVDSFASALPSPSLTRSELPSPRSSLHSSNRERRLDDVLAGGSTILDGPHDRMMEEEEDEEGEDDIEGHQARSQSTNASKTHNDLLASDRKGPERPYKSPERKDFTLDTPPPYLRNGMRSVSAETSFPIHPLSRPERGEAGPSSSSFHLPLDEVDTVRSLQSASAATNHEKMASKSPTPTLDASQANSIANNRATSRSPNAHDAEKEQLQHFAASSDPATYGSSVPATIESSKNTFVSPERSRNALRQKLKKTGGLFKRTGSSTSTSKNATLVKRSSSSSLASESGASIAHSTKSAPGNHQARWYNSVAEPLPNMPDIFKDSHSQILSRGSSSQTLQAGSQSINRQGQHMSPSSADGSASSTTTEMKHTLQAWKREMDSTLKQSGQNLDQKTKITTPNGKWTPTPQLPECKMLNRPRSFMDDDEDEDGGAAEQSETLKSADTVTSRRYQSTDRDKQYLTPVTSHARRSTSLGVEQISSSSQTTSNSSAILPPSRTVSSDDTGRYRKLRNRNEDVSYASVASYETAIEGPSKLLEDEGAKSSHVKDSTVTQSNLRSDNTLGSVPNMIDSHDEDSNEEALAQELALQCWMEDESHRSKDRIAEWLGKNEPLHEASRRYYMMRFDFTKLRIDVAFRRLCDKLYLRAETQQIDRILSAFGQRYFDCNPQSKRLLLNADVVHALVFSILLLNTDLHVAEMHDRMTRNQFVRNTMSAILESNESLAVSSPIASDDTQEIVGSSGLKELDDSAGQESLSGSLTAATSFEARKDSIDTMSIRSIAGITIDSRSYNSAPTKAWEAEMETLLKEIYTAVKNDQIRLPFGINEVGTTPSTSKTFKFSTDRVNALKRGSIRGLQGLLGSTNPSSSTRVDESPSLSRVSLNSTHKSQSDSFTGLSTPSTSLLSASSYALPPTLGFANTLFQSIIKEAKDEDDNTSIGSAHDDPTDDELALMGPPWAKEGNLTRKLYWEAPQRRAKEKNWTNCFVVVQKGNLSMFKFGETGTSNTSLNQSVVGGGNWLSNATCIGETSLAHTVANALPPPGYNRARPHVFALTLPNGRVYFFQAGHEELLQEWVSTCNYWAARQSKEPLAGGVSNMEYGWNCVMPDETSRSEALGDERLHLEPSRTSFSNINSDTRSIRSGKSAKSLRIRATNGSLFRSQTGGTMGNLTSPSSISLRDANHRNISDRPLYINEWREPAPPTVSSVLNEEDQLEACKKYKQRVEMELTQHRALRKPMMDYLQSISNQQGGTGGGTTNRLNTANLNKAVVNFDRKASYLLSDLTKFTLYTATLISANKLKAEKRDARSIDRMMLKADEESSKMKEEEEGPPIKMS